MNLLEQIDITVLYIVERAVILMAFRKCTFSGACRGDYRSMAHIFQ